MILRCLIVDDQPAKANQIREAIAGEMGDGNVEFVMASSANEATDVLRSTLFDIMIVDINLPIRRAELPASDGGIRLLQHVARGTAGIHRPFSIIGVTAYDALVVSAAREFQLHGWALVTYSPEKTDWQQAIIHKCLHVTEYKSAVARIHEARVDVCFLTALYDTEMEAVLDLPCFDGASVVAENGLRLSKGTIVEGMRRLSVIACAAPEMGNAASAAVASKMLMKYRPRMCLMTGICAGIAAQIGDIAVAEFALHYESGKWIEGGGGEAVFKPAPRYLPAGVRILDAIRRYKLDSSATLQRSISRWRGISAPKMPEIVIGPVASGAAVVENRDIVEGLTFRDRKLVGLEMESYGFYLAARSAVDADTEFAMIKGVCDLASPPKQDGYQKYAAFLSAQCAISFVAAEAAVPGGLFGA